MVDGNSNTNKELDSTRKHSSLWSSLCAPLNIVPLLPLFFSIFCCVVVFLGNFDFFILFFDIFPSLRSTKEVTTENELKQVKAWHVEISEDVLKIDKKLVTTKRGSCDQFLTNFKISDPDIAGDGRI